MFVVGQGLVANGGLELGLCYHELTRVLMSGWEEGGYGIADWVEEWVLYICLCGVGMDWD